MAPWRWRKSATHNRQRRMQITAMRLLSAILQSKPEDSVPLARVPACSSGKGIARAETAGIALQYLHKCGRDSKR